MDLEELPRKISRSYTKMKIGIIGAGAMGVVYLADDLELEGLHQRGAGERRRLQKAVSCYL